MSIHKLVYTFLTLVLLLSCNKKESNQTKNSTQKTVENLVDHNFTKSQLILNETIAAHGGDLYNSAHYSFIFRGDTYYFKNDGNNYEYKKVSKKGDSTIQDILVNNVFSRTVNGKVITVSEKEKTSGTGAINSVIYFATLPNKLEDSAVQSKYIESTNINDISYHVIEITFNKEGGGQDHEDEFYYWINKHTKKIDYLAYNYKVNKGGVRFRNAYNRRIIDGITFQDYVNFMAKTETPLKELPSIFEAGKLKEISKIKIENIINLNKN